MQLNVDLSPLEFAANQITLSSDEQILRCRHELTQAQRQIDAINQMYPNDDQPERLLESFEMSAAFFREQLAKLEGENDGNR